jgi:hypothetical protein
MIAPQLNRKFLNQVGGEREFQQPQTYHMVVTNKQDIARDHGNVRVSNCNGIRTLGYNKALLGRSASLGVCRSASQVTSVTWTKTWARFNQPLVI